MEKRSAFQRIIAGCLSFVIALSLIFSNFATAYAITVDAGSAEGSGGGSAILNGMAVASSEVLKNCVGYRVSVIEADGVTTKGGIKVDLMKNTIADNKVTYGATYSFIRGQKNKAEWNADLNAAIKSKAVPTGYDDGTYIVWAFERWGLTWKNPSNIEAYLEQETPVNKILEKMGFGSIDDLNPGDKMIVEPLWALRLGDNVWYFMTLTEIGMYGRYQYGGSSKGGTAPWTNVDQYTNRYFPNALYAPDGSGLWPAATKIGDSAKCTFNDLIKKAYGVAIVYSTPYTITYDLQGGSLSAANPTVYTSGTETFTLNNPTKTGYTFAGWTGSNGSTPQTTVTIEKGSIGNRHYIANWTPNTNTQYKVNHYTQNLAGTGYDFNSTDNKTGTTGASVTLSSLAKGITGFTYSHGAVGGSTVTTTTVLADGSRVIDLYYTRNSYTVTLNKGTGIASVSGAGTYKYGASVIINAGISSGYTWGSWSGTHSTTTRQYTFTMPAYNVTDTANASINTYTITYDLQGGSVATANPTSYTVNTATFTLNNPTKRGHNFTGWTGSNGSTPQTTVTIAKGSTGNRSYTANWSAIPYTINYNANGGSGTMSSHTVNYGGSVKIKDNTFTRTGYTFAGWTTRSDGVDDGYGWSTSTGAGWSGTWSYVNGQYGITSNTLTLYARWTPNTIKLTLNANGGSGHTSMVYYKYGINKFYTDAACTNQITAITRPTRADYTYDTSTGFYGDGTSGGTNGERYIAYDGVEFASDLCTDIYKDATLTCSWIYSPSAFTNTVNHIIWGGNPYIEYTFANTAFSKNKGDTITFNASLGTTVPNGTTLSHFGTADFAGSWTSYQLGNTVTQPAKSVSMNAYYHANEYTITYNLNGGTNHSSNPSSYTVLYGVTLQNPTRSGYTFTGWTDQNGNKVTGINAGANASFSSGSDMYNKLASRTTGNITLTANWATTTHTVTSYHYYEHPVNGWVHFNTTTNTVASGSSFMPSNVTPPTGYLPGNNYGLYDGSYNGIGSGTVGVNSFTVTGDRILHIHYYPKTINVIFHRNTSGSDTTTASQTFKYNATGQSFSDKGWSRPGYTLLGWALSPTATSINYSILSGVSDDWINTYSPSVDLYAVWSPNTYTLTFDPNGGSVSPTSKTMSYGTVFTDMPTPTRSGYNFTRWYATFNGSNYLNLGRQYMYEDKISIHFEAYSGNWANVGNSDAQRIISCTESGGWNIESNGGYIQFAMYDKGVGYKSIKTSTAWSSLSAGWHTFDMVFDGSKMYGYVDGTLVATSAAFSSGRIGYNASNSIFVGAEAAGSASAPGGQYFNGAISNLVIKNQGTRITSAHNNFMTPMQNMTLYAEWVPATYTNSIDHWMWGFNGEGNNGSGAAFHIATTTFSATNGSNFVLGTDRGTTIPNGFTLRSSFGTSSISGSWAGYAMGTTVTQKAGSMGFEYDYDPITYTITYNLDGGTNHASNPSTYNVLYGVALQNPTKAGYTFDGWYNGSTKVTGINAGANATFSSPSDMYSKLASRTTGNITLTAKWKVNSTKLTLNANGGTVETYTEISSGYAADTKLTLAKNVSVPVYNGSTISLLTNQKYLLDFSHQSDGTTVFDVDLYPDTLPQVLVEATTKKQTYSWAFSSAHANMSSAQIRFFNDVTVPNPNNIYISSIRLYKVGSAAASTSKTIEAGSTYGTLPTPTRTGYTFNGWYTAASGGTKVSSSTVMGTSNVTLYAQWTPNTIKLTLNANGGSGHTSVVYFKYGINKFYTDAACTNQITAITRPTRAGYTYDTSKGFCGDGTSGGTNGERYIAYESVEFAGDLCTDIYKDATLTCYWTPVTYSISYNLNGGSVATANPTSYTVETPSFSLNNPTKTGYTFLGWTGSNDLSGGLSGYTASSPFAATIRDHLLGNPFNVVAGNTYRVFVTAKCTMGTLPMQGGIWYTAQSSGSAWDSYSGAFTKLEDLDNGYARYYKDITVPSGKTQGQVYIQLEQDHSGGSASWSIYDIHCVKANETVTIAKGSTGNRSYTANWKPNTIKATLDNQGATTAGTPAYWYQYKTTQVINGITAYYYNDSACTDPLSNGYQITKPTKTGYTFEGYYTGTNGTGTRYVDENGMCVNNLYSTVASDITLYAKWTKNTKVTLDNQGATTAGTPAYWYQYNKTQIIGGETVYYYTDLDCTTPLSGYKITKPTKTGYTFGGYYTGTNGTGTQYVDSNGTCVNNLYSTVASDITLYAKWTPVSYTITYHSNAGLPAGYKILSYIEATGSQYIKTGVTGAAQWQIDIQYTNLTTRQLMGYGGSGAEYWGVQTDGNYGLASWAYMNVKAGGKDTILHNYGEKGLYYLYTKNTKLNVGVTDVSSKEYHLFAITNSYYNHAKLYRATATQNGVLIRDFIPCMDPNGNVGLYDIVNGKFYGNAGTGTFKYPENYPATYTVAQSVTHPTPSLIGYTFGGWYENSSFTGSPVTSIPVGSTGNKVYYAKWTPVTYSVAYNGNGNTGGSTATSTHTYDAAKALTSNGFTRAGYTFAGWNTKADGSGIAFGNGESVRNLANTNGATVTLYAQWNLVTYTISYNLNGGTLPSGKTNPTSYNVTTSNFTLNNPTKTGYTFAGWTGSNGTTPQTTVTIAKGSTGNKSYTANWTPNTDTKYTVNHYTEDLTGSTYSLNSTDNKTGTTDATLTLADLKKTISGFTYSHGKVGSNTVTTTTILPDGSRVIDLYYTRNSYTVTLNTDTGIASVSGAGTYKYGASVTIDATVSQGYSWNKWTGTHSTTTKQYTFTMPAGNVTDTATATPNTIKLTLNANGGSGHTAVVYYKYGIDKFYTDAACTKQITAITRPTRTGYAYDTSKGFCGDGTSGGNNGERYIAFYNVDLGNIEFAGDLCTDIYKDATLTCYWTPITYTISYNLNGGSVETANPTSYTIETPTFTLNNPTKEGYTFDGWTGSNGTTPQTTVTIPQGSIGNLEFIANFTPIEAPYTVEHWLEKINVSGTDYANHYTKIDTEEFIGLVGNKVTPAVKTYEGFTSPAPQEATIKADGSLVVKYYYTRNSFTVTLNKGTGIASVSGAGTYDFEATVQIDAELGEGYLWNGWIVQSGGIEKPDAKSYSFIMPNNAVTLRANGRVNGTELDPEEWVEWEPEDEYLIKHIYRVGPDIALEITPDKSNPAIESGSSTMRSGYAFSAEQKTGWKNADGYDAADSSMVTGFQTISAHFPEFRTNADLYAIGRNKVRWMEDPDKDGTYELPVNTEDADEENERLHFTPIWFPDGDYIMWTQSYDCWTPVGMMSAMTQSNPIKIDGTLFDDWYIGRKGG